MCQNLLCTCTIAFVTHSPQIAQPSPWMANPMASSETKPIKSRRAPFHSGLRANIMIILLFMRDRPSQLCSTSRPFVLILYYNFTPCLLFYLVRLSFSFVIFFTSSQQSRSVLWLSLWLLYLLPHPNALGKQKSLCFFLFTFLLLLTPY